LAVVASLLSGGSLPTFSPAVAPQPVGEITASQLVERVTLPPHGIPLPPPDPWDACAMPAFHCGPADADVLVRQAGIPLPPPDPWDACATSALPCRPLTRTSA
jgi:hypothetical protein